MVNTAGWDVIKEVIRTCGYPYDKGHDNLDGVDGCLKE